MRTFVQRRNIGAGLRLSRRLANRGKDTVATILADMAETAMIRPRMTFSKRGTL